MPRTRLLLGTAIAAALIGPPAAAQFPFVTDVDVTSGGSLPTITDVGSTRIFTLNAPRTYLDHGQGFFLSTGTTVRFNFASPGPGGVALLRADSGFAVLGTLEARLGPAATDPLGGNLWLFSRNGILVAEGGRIAAGGVLLSNALPELLTSPATRQALLADDAFAIEALLAPLSTQGIAILSGAGVEAAGGMLAIVAQNVQQQAGTSIRAARGTLLVGAANTYTIRLARNASNDFDLVEFEVPAGGGTFDGGAPIDLSGSVAGANVWLSIVGSSNLASAIIRATGTVVATAAAADQGHIVLSAGSGIAGNEPGLPQDAAPTRIRAELADLAADGDIRIRQDEGELLAAFAGGDIRIETRQTVPAGPAALGSLEAGGSILADVGGDVLGLGAFTAGADIIVRSRGAVALGSLSAGDDIVAVAAGPLVSGAPDATIESRNEGPDVTRDSDATDPSGGSVPIRSIFLQSEADRVQLAGLVTGFTQGSVLSALAFDIDIRTGTAAQFLAGGLSAFSDDLLSTSRIALDDSFPGPGPSIRLGEIVSGPLRLRSSGSLSVDRLVAAGFAGIDATGDVSVGDARVEALRGNPGSLALVSDSGSVSLGGADVDGDLILIARQGAVRTSPDATLRFGDDLYAISGRESLGRGIILDTGTTLASKAGFPDVPGNEILDNGDPSRLVPEFDRDVPGNGRVADLRALAGYPGFPAAPGGNILFEGAVETLDLLTLDSESASVRLVAAGSRLPELVVIAGLDVEILAEAIAAPSFFAGRDAAVVLTGPDPVEILESGAGRDLSVTTAGPLAIVSALAGRDATLTAASLDASGLAGPIRNARFTTTEAGLAVDTLSVSGTIALASAAGLEAGVLTAGDDILLAAPGAATVDLASVTPGTDQDGDGFNIVATAASFAASGLEGADDIRITTSGETALAGTTAARRDILVDAGTLSASDFEAGRDLVLVVRAGGIAGPLFSAVRDVSLSASAGVSAGEVRAGRDAVLAAGTQVAVDLIRATRDVGLSGGGVSAQRVEAGRDIAGTLAGAFLADIVEGGDDVRIAADSVRASLRIRSTGLGEDSEGDGRNVGLVAPAGVSVGTGPDGELDAPDDVTVRSAGGLFQMPDGSRAGAGRDLLIEARGAAIGFAEAGRDLTLNLAGGGSVLRRRLAAGRDLTLRSGGDLEIDAVAAAGRLLVEAAGRLGAGPATAGTDIDIRAGSIGPSGSAAFSAEAGRDVRIVSDGGVEGGGPLAAGRDTTVTAGGTVRFATMEAGDDLAVAAGAGDILATAVRTTGVGEDGEGDGANIRLEGLNAVLGTVSAATDFDAALAGTLGIEALATGRDTRVTASALSLGAGADIGRDLVITATAGLFEATSPLSAGRDVAVTGAGDVRLGEVLAGRDIGLAGAGLVETGRLAAPGALVATAGSLRTAEASVGGAARLTTTAGELLLAGTLAAGGDVQLTAPDAPDGILRIGRVEAGGRLDATAFSIRAAPGGGTAIAAGPVRMVGTGSATIDLEEVVSDDDVDLISPSIRVGFVRSTGLGPDVDGDGFNVRLVGGLGEFIAIDAPTDIRARMAGPLGIADAIAGRDADLEADSIRIQPRQAGLVAGRDARLVAATTLEAGRVSAGDDVTMEAGGAATLGTVETRGDGADLEGDGSNIRIVAAGAEALALAAPGDIVIDSTTGPAVLGQGGGVAAGRDLLVTGTTLDLAAPSSGRDLRLTATAGDIIGSAFAAVRDLALAASGRIEALTAAAGRDLDLAAGGDLEIIDSASAGRDAQLRGGSVTGPLGFPFIIAAERDVRIESTAGPVSVRATAGDDVRVRSAGSLRLGATTTGAGEDLEGDGSRIVAEAAGQALLEASAAAGDLDLTAGGPVEAFGTPVAGGSLRITGTEVQLPLGATAEVDVEVRATDGPLFTAGLVRAGRDLALTGAAADFVDVGGQGLAAGRDLAISGDEIGLGSGVRVAAGRDARLSATGFIGTRRATIEAGRDIDIATDRGINFGRLVAGDDIRVTSRANLVLGDEVLTTGLGPDDEGDGSTVGIFGNFVEIAAGESAGDMRLSGRDAVFAGFRDGAAVAPGLTAGRDLVVRSSGIRLNLAGVGRNLDAEASTGTLEVAGNLAAQGSVRLEALLLVKVEGGISAGADVDLRSRVSLVRVDGPVTAGDDLRLAAGSAGVRAGALTTTGLGPDPEADGPVMEVRGGTGTVTLGPVSAAQDFLAEAAGAVAVEAITTVRDARVTAASLALGAGSSIGRDLLITATGTGFTAPGPLSAGRDIRVEGVGDLRLAALVAGRNASLETAGSLETGAITAPGNLVARAARMAIASASVGGAASLETVGGELALPGTVTTGGDLLLRAPEVAGGILRLGRIAAGGVVDARAFSILSAPGGGAVAAGGPVRMVGTGSATIDLEEVISDDDVDLASPVIRVGLVRATGIGPDRDGDGFNIRMDGGTGTFGTLEAPTDILARFTSSLQIASTATAGRDSVLAAGSGTLALGSAQAGGVATIAGGGFTLNGTLEAAEVRFVASGPMRFGGAAGGGGFVVPADALARISAPGGISASTGAVPRATTPQGPASAAFEAQYGVGGSADLSVDSFRFDPAAVAQFGFYAGPGASIRVVGDIAPVEAGGRIILGANPVEGLTPRTVLVSGSLGAGQLFLQDCYVALFPLENLAITALGDVIFGDAAFQAAVAAADPAAIDVQAGTPDLPPSPADDRLFVVAETMSVAAPGRIVSQNRSSVPGSYAGLVLANQQQGPRLPTVLTVTGGSVVDLSGVVVNGAGRAFFGPQAARSGAVAATSRTARFNSCAINGTGSCLPPLADPGLGFRPDQFAPQDPLAPEAGLLRGEILFLLDDRASFRVGVEDGAIFLRRDEEEERRDREPAAR